MKRCPESIADLTPDTVAECMEVSRETYRELWRVLSNPKFKKRKLGGDGSNGTTEVPDDFDGGMRKAWKFLSETAREELIEVAKRRDAELDELVSELS